MIDIFMDESIQVFDKMLMRISICAVETEMENNKVVFQELDELVNDSTRFAVGNSKIHFSDLNDSQRTLLVEIISKIELSAKIYVYYVNFNAKTAKANAMINTVNHLKYIHSRKQINIQVEEASDYEKTELNELLSSGDSIEFLLPDAILHIFNLHLSDTKKHSKSSNVGFYKLIREKIRLQYFRIGSESKYLIRENKI